MPWATIEGLAVHHDAIKAPTHHDNRPNGCFDRVADIHRAHLMHPTENYCAIAYNFWICPHGETFEGRGWDYRSGATGGANHLYVAACVSGSPGTLNEDVEDALQTVRDGLLVHKRSALKVRPHSDFKATACPGDPLRAWIARKGYEDEEEKLAFTPEEEALLRQWIADVKAQSTAPRSVMRGLLDFKQSHEKVNHAATEHGHQITGEAR